jgi:hypothetical protein
VASHFPERAPRSEEEGISGTGYVYVVPDAPELLRAELGAVPGLRLYPLAGSGLSIYAPLNAAWLAHELVTRSGADFRAHVPKPRPAASAKLALPYLREWVPAFLTPYQLEGIAWALAIAPGESGHLWHPTGAGKTLESIIWALARPGLTVAVTKASICTTWAHEVERYCQGVPLLRLEGTRPPASLALPPPPLFLLLSYSVLPAWIGVLERLRPRSVIYDEAHSAGKSGKRWDAILAKEAEPLEPALVEPVEPGFVDPFQFVLPPAPLPTPQPKVKFLLKDNVAAAAMRLSKSSKRRLATTRTPIRDRVRDLWAQLDLVHPWQWGKRRDFEVRYCDGHEGRFAWESKGKSNLTELRRRLAFVTHMIPYSVTTRDLPPKRRQVTYVAVKDQVRPEAIADELRAAARRGPSALLEMRLMEAASRKRRVVAEHVQDALESNQKVVVFTGRRRDAEALERTVRERIRCSPLSKTAVPIFMGHGGHSDKRRDEMREEYMAAPGPACLIGTGDAWGEGLNLQDSDLLILAMLPYTSGQIIQQEGRVAGRRGQTRPVLILYLIAEGSADEHVVQILLSKLPAVEKTGDFEEIEGFGRELGGGLSEEELIAEIARHVLEGDGAG